MTQKLLPLPVGERSPQGSDVRFWQQYGFRTGLDRSALGLGLVLAAIGAWLGLNPAPVEVSVDRAAYHVGSTKLPAGQPGSYGGDAAVAMRESDGQLRAAAAGKLAGVPMQGLCVYVLGTDIEQCIFVVGDASFHAEDHLQGDHWRRRYDDGHEVQIRLNDPAHPTPVPIPIGWR